MAGSATNPEEEEDWDANVTPPPCALAPGWKDLVSQVNQDPRAESITYSGIGTTTMEENVESNAVRESQLKMKLVVPFSITPVDQMI